MIYIAHDYGGLWLLDDFILFILPKNQQRHDVQFQFPKKHPVGHCYQRVKIDQTCDIGNRGNETSSPRQVELCEFSAPKKMGGAWKT